MSRHGGRHLRVGQKGGGGSKLTRRELTFADQRILHRLRQAAEVVGGEEDVSVSG
jgi:hypothetical protein